MSWRVFQTKVPGKWVLAGEHSVLRGGIAIALPHPDCGLELDFEPGATEGWKVEPTSAAGVVDALMQAAASGWAQGKVPQPQGKLRIRSSIPIGAGLGSSAALCVAISRWLVETFGLPQDSLHSFATSLEHQFHGKSSGMDVAVILAGEPISFSMEKRGTPLHVKKIPKFTFHDTGLRSKTQDCVAQVEFFRKERPEESSRWDAAMDLASQAAKVGLIRFDQGHLLEGVEKVAEAMKRAQECFYAWGLVPAQAKMLESRLLSEGAKAVKLTGAGGGGMMVALWGE